MILDTNVLVMHLQANISRVSLKACSAQSFFVRIFSCLPFFTVSRKIENGDSELYKLMALTEVHQTFRCKHISQRFPTGLP